MAVLCLPHSVVLFPCKKCIGGQVLSNYNKFECLQCGAEHDSQVNLLSPRQPRPGENFHIPHHRGKLKNPGNQYLTAARSHRIQK